MSQTHPRPLALVTGASGGIGEAIAHELAARGHDLILVARTARKLETLAEILRVRHGVHSHVVALDLADPGAPLALVDELTRRDLRSGVDVLVNNAGFASYGEFHTLDLTHEMRMIQLNIATLTELTHRFLLAMLERRAGRVLNVASTAAFMPGPLMAVYYASKAYVLSFSEAVSEELRGTGVTVTALCPGPVETGFQAAASMQDSRLVKNRRIQSADTVARQGVEAMLAGRRVVVTGLTNQIQALSPRFLPRAVVPGLVKNAQNRAH